MPATVFDPPERFVAGTVGPPGGRTFFLQASGGGRLVSVSLEKVQVSVLADRIHDLLDTHAEGAAVEPPDGGDTDPLATPSEDEFRRIGPRGLRARSPNILGALSCSSVRLFEGIVRKTAAAPRC